MKLSVHLRKCSYLPALASPSIEIQVQKKSEEVFSRKLLFSEIKVLLCISER